LPVAASLSSLHITFWGNGLLPELMEGSGGGRRRRTVTVGRGDHAAGAMGGEGVGAGGGRMGLGKNLGGNGR
jgi:hypothetical protein